MTLALTSDVWSHRVGIGGPVDVRVTREQRDAMTAAGLRFEVLIDDVQARVDAERAAQQNAADGPWHAVYHNLADIRTYINGLAAANPALASVGVAGQSLQSRDLFYIRITGAGGAGNRPAVFFHGCQHAREWITPAANAFIADRLLADYGSDPRVTTIMNNVEFVILPVANPDGYEWSWTNERLWRKNRRANAGGCIGVDNNRNWGFQWGGEGASTDPCNDTYRGTAGFSEPETQVLRDFIIANPRFAGYIDIHSYSQLIMSPWAYTSALPPNHSVFQQLNAAMAQAVFNTHGKTYTFGPIYTTIYPASGGGVDWVYGARDILAFTFELRDTGVNGFLLPPDQIIPTGQETYAAVLTLAEYFLPIRFSLPAAFPTTITPQITTTVQVRIDNGYNATVAAGTERLYVRQGTAGAFAPISLTSLGGGLYEGTLPASACGTTVQFYFQADASTGSTIAYPVAGAAAPFQATAVTSTIAFHDNMETNLGWTVANTALTGGAWVRADPVGTTNAGAQANPENDNTPAPGVNCYVTANGAVGGGAGAADVDGGPTVLTSPQFSLAGASSASIQFARWLYSANGVTDTMTAQVSNNDGATWTTLATIGGTAGWGVQSIPLPGSVAPTSLMRLRFSVADNPNDSVTEAAIDDLVVSALTCPAVVCYANCDGSTSSPVLNVNDFTCFLNLYAAGASSANCDGSTAAPVLNVNDFTCFLNLFAAGCP
ncbi:MAG: M14 family zinc carboxypeptidase [Phycisphaerales bacterium]